jgi:Lar family restriction alleviation protein
MTDPAALLEGTTPDLLPCPFCGGNARAAAVHAGGIEWAQVECRAERGCGAVGPTPATEAEAIAAWNTRPQQQQLTESAERIRKLEAEVERLHSLAKANNDLARMETRARVRLQYDNAKLRDALEARTTLNGADPK